MKKYILFLIMISPFVLFAQDLFNGDLDSSLDTIWNQNRQQQSLPPEFANRDPISVIPPTPVRQVPGSLEVILPLEQTEGPVNQSPNDARAYILYNRAIIAYQNKQFENARSLYRDLVRRYPDSTYSPYALYSLSLDEEDYRRKIRILLTIKERFPLFPHRDIILDSLGDIYYLLNSGDAAEEVLKESKSYYANYLRAMIAMDTRKPNLAISLIREALKKAPNNETAYKIYILYAEALIALKSYKNALTILEKSVELRPWAYDNGVGILLNAGKSFYHSNMFPEALYTFSTLRIRFSRSAEAKEAEQYIESLSRKNIVETKNVPWIAKSFDTIIKTQPIRQLTAPRTPTLADIQEMNNLPKGPVAEPSLDDVAVVSQIPIPVPQRNNYSVLVPLTDAPNIDIITVTNVVVVDVTNLVGEFITNRVFVIETNTFTNNITVATITEEAAVVTNVVQVWETNTVVSYEPVVLWRTNYRQVDVTNLVTNIIDFVMTNQRIELLPLQTTNYNFVNRPRNITNVIYRDITNRYLEYGLNNTTNWKEDIVRKRFVEIVPSWKTTYQSVDTNQLVTNVITEIITNQRLELVPRWISNVRTNDAYRRVDTIITNTRLRIAPRWITNFQVIQTNMRDVVITNVVNQVVSETNLVEKVVTNVYNKIHTNLIERVITNVPSGPQPITNILTNITQEIVTNQGSPSEPEYAPVEISVTPQSIENEDQRELIEEPIYGALIEEAQIKFVSQEVANLERQASLMAERSAGIAGEYGFSNNKGFLIRVAQLKDLSVANIVLRDINDLNLGYSPGIYYRNSIYFIEIRSIKSREIAETIYHKLYQLGYTDAQIFEQYEVVEYQDE